jgi:predicted nuclease of predicted toxin-antitoxin system
LKIKLDENLSRHLTGDLVALGHDIRTVAEEGLLSQPDEVVAKAASQEGRMLFTLDLGLADVRKYAPGSHPGVVLFRPLHYGPLAVNQFVVTFVRDHDLANFMGCIVIVEPTRLRIRRSDSEEAAR